MRLTQAGQYLLSLANRLLPQFELAEERMRQYAQGERGTLRIGMECAPCYQWLLKVVSPYLAHWPDVDVDVKQRFQFGGIGALIGYEIDVLVTPDPLKKPELHFEPVFDYEQVLVVADDHPLAGEAYVTPEQLTHEVLITYPVETDRLDIYAVPHAREPGAEAPQGDRDDRHHAADGGERPWRGGIASLARGRICGLDAAYTRATWKEGDCETDFPRHAQDG